MTWRRLGDIVADMGYNDITISGGPEMNGSPAQLAFTLNPPRARPVGQLELEWRDFHRDNPHIYRLVCRYADEVIALGLKEYAIATIWERLRWHLTIETKDPEFKLPNNHRAYYARLWLHDHPRHPGFFRTSSLRSVTGAPGDRYGRTT